ncbi:MAG: 5-methyltetrahydropteroyltriglutamate--homocysteine S-methyltransferase, partial [Cytophagales bacterium]|nr:5-methyltetrahydropteroyltriglutamate--homocysteine S-methyltransferase [Cytophagales bacterium]
MLTQNLGYPRIGSFRELKKANEKYWKNAISQKELQKTAQELRLRNWTVQKQAGIDLVPSNDFSFYDQVLDMSLVLGAIPSRYLQVTKQNSSNTELDLYFAMARGYQQDGLDLTAMEMTKWFDTNYHYIVPEFTKNQEFKLFSKKPITEFIEAKEKGFQTKPVLLGLVSYLLLGKEKENGFHRLDLVENLLPVYKELIAELVGQGATYIQLDEPCLVLDLDEKAKEVYALVYKSLKRHFPHIKFVLATYFGELGDNENLALSLPVDVLHLDLVRGHQQLDRILAKVPEDLTLSLGVVDGRNIWKNDYQHSLQIIEKAEKALGSSRVWIAPSCSLLHVPYDLEVETNEQALPKEVKNWLAFAKQKLSEVTDLLYLSNSSDYIDVQNNLANNIDANEERRTSTLIHNQEVKQRVGAITDADAQRYSNFTVRQEKQKSALNLPLFPSTTIGSFPQTKEVRQLRAKFKKGEVSQAVYEKQIQHWIKESVDWQEEVGLDVLVHGEFERNDMVEYFGELLEGYAFSQYGWVQSYGSRAVKPPIIFGDVSRKNPMTVEWTKFAQSKTNKLMKGMLTGPITILQWSFVRNDQPRNVTANQIALAIRDEVVDLEKAGIKVIQIDEPAIREGLPLRQNEWKNYFDWAVKAFRISASGVEDETQIHTHMCYSEFNDMIEAIADMDADVITIETSRSQMELLDAFVEFNYPNEIGPGVYDIHSPRVPTAMEIYDLLQKA